VAETPKEVSVKLTLDASDYIAGMRAATRATKRFTKAVKGARKARLIKRMAPITLRVDNSSLTSVTADMITGRRIYGARL
jgi:hypothetical protein